MKMAEMGMTTREIAHIFDLHKDHVGRKWRREIRMGKAKLRQKLRVWQVEAAEKGNPQMLIWLGRQYLKQTEKNEVTNVNRTDPDSCDEATLIERAQSLLARHGQAGK